MMLFTRFVRQSLLVSLFVGGAAVCGVRAQETQEATADIQQIMTPEQFKAAGLEKLSPEELQNLNKWLYGYRKNTAKVATQKAERQAADVTESRVDGTFNGIGGSTIVKLEDGTVWKQANPDEHWRAPGLDHPAATVVKTPFGRKMQIAGMPGFYVDPVR